MAQQNINNGESGSSVRAKLNSNFSELYTGDYVPVIIFNGESNSGGYALNSDLTAPEAAARPSVQILNNTTLLFENLDIGTNNLIDHAGLSANGTHGWENGLAGTVEDGDWSFSSVYLIKTGQGGSIIAQWDVGSTYWNKFLERVDAAKTLIAATGKKPLFFLWYTQGINDAIAGTSIETWKTLTKNHFIKIRHKLGYVPIITPYLPETYGTFNAAIAGIASEDPNIYLILSGDATLRDANHWNYAGMKLLAQRMAAKTLSIGDKVDQYQLSLLFALSLRPSTGVTPPPPSSNTDLGDWIGLVGATSDVDGYINKLSSPSGGRKENSIDATSAFSYVVEMENANEQVSVVVYLDDTNDTNYGWNSTNDYLTGVYYFGGNLWHTSIGGSANTTAITPTFPSKVKVEKSGNDVVYSVSTDGISYTPIYTASGVLSGQTTIYVKALFAGSGSRVRLS